MKSMIGIFFLLIMFSFSSKAQQAEVLYLDSAYAAARLHYPMLKDKGLIRTNAEMGIQNLKHSWLPQVQLNAQASYQSDVTQVPFSMPGFSIEPLSKDQYRAVADISQLLYDGGQLKSQQQLQLLEAQTEQSRVEVELHLLRERVSQYFLSVLLFDAQLRQASIVKKDIDSGIEKVQVQVEQGIAFRSNLDILLAESLKAGQRIAEINHSRQAMLEVLGLYMGRQLDTNVELKAMSSFLETELVNQRPELDWYKQQTLAIKSREQLLNAGTRPKFQLFAQGGYGRPGLNMLKNEFDLYYTAGLRVSWSLANFYTLKKSRAQLDISQQRIKVQEEVFRQQTESRQLQERAQIRKLESLITSDKEIIILRESITKAAKAQLENNVITANDFLREVNAEDQARQSLLLHEIQLLQAKINYQNISGQP